MSSIEMVLKIFSMDTIPSILVSDEKTFLAQTIAVSDVVSMVQIDICDGLFVPNITWADAKIVAEHLKIDCELHLMVENPLEEAKKWEDVPQVKRVYAHYESNPGDIQNIVHSIRSYEWEVGLALNPDTPITVLKTLAEDIGAVLVMGVYPGRQGQILIPKSLEKIQTIRHTYPRLRITLDGGVNEKTLPDIVRVHPDAICPGSAVFGNEKTPQTNIQNLRGIIDRVIKDYETIH